MVASITDCIFSSTMWPMYANVRNHSHTFIRACLVREGFHFPVVDASPASGFARDGTLSFTSPILSPANVEKWLQLEWNCCSRSCWTLHKEDKDLSTIELLMQFLMILMLVLQSCGHTRTFATASVIQSWKFFGGCGGSRDAVNPATSSAHASSLDCNSDDFATAMLHHVCKSLKCLTISPFLFWVWLFKTWAYLYDRYEYSTCYIHTITHTHTCHIMYICIHI